MKRHLNDLWHKGKFGFWFSMLSFLLTTLAYSQAIDKTEYAERRVKLMEKMGSGVGVIFGAMETRRGENFQNAQFYYLTGVETPKAILVLLPKSKREILYLPPYNERYGVWDDPELSPGDSAVAVTGIQQIRSRGERFHEEISRYCSSVETLYVNIGRPGNLNEAPSKVVYEINKIREHFPALTIKNVSPLIEELRGIKSAAEIALMRKSCRIAGLGIMEGIRSAEPGMYEYQVEAVVEYLFKKEGAQWPAFFSIVGSGPNSVILHHRKNQRQIQEGDLIVLDVGALYNYYGSDITRTFPVSGHFTQRQREIYSIVLKAQKKAIEAVKPGLTLSDIHKIAKQVIDDAGYGQYFIHGTSHFLAGGRSAPLKPGMCFTIEPGIYIPEENLGVRIEDDILVTENGCEVLTAFVPKEIAEIEKLVAEKGILQK